MSYFSEEKGNSSVSSSLGGLYEGLLVSYVDGLCGVYRAGDGRGDKDFLDHDLRLGSGGAGGEEEGETGNHA